MKTLLVALVSVSVVIFVLGCTQNNNQNQAANNNLNSSSITAAAISSDIESAANDINLLDLNYTDNSITPITSTDLNTD